MKTLKLTIAMISFLSFNAMACPGQPNCPMHANGDMPKEKRAEMAAVHAQMAECLKSEKPMEECHKIMADHMGAPMGEHTCAQGDGNKSCPMHKEMKKEKSKK